MKSNNFIPMLSLQVFADGGAGAAAGATGDGGTAQGQGVTAGAASQQNTGVKGNPLAGVKYGIQQEESASAAEVQNQPQEQPQVDRKAEFEKLIKGEYKDLYDARVQDTVRNRLKGSKETVDKYNTLAPALEILAKNYGVDTADIAGLAKAILGDASYFEAEAMERGMTPQQLMQLREIQRENDNLKRRISDQERTENANRQYTQWMQQEQETKMVYPSFDLKVELQNPEFANLLRSNVNVKTAYEVIHKDEIIPAAMQFAAQAVEQKLTNKIIAGGARPAENGMSAQSAAVVKSDVTKLTKYDIDEVARRVARGEKVTFG